MGGFFRWSASPEQQCSWYPLEHRGGNGHGKRSTTGDRIVASSFLVGVDTDKKDGDRSRNTHHHGEVVEAEKRESQKIRYHKTPENGPQYVGANTCIPA